MPRFLRAKITCFYCGKPSQYRKGDFISNFQCKHCEGTNFLDENGDITDVPAQDVDTPRKSPARSLPSESVLQPLVETTSPQDTLFCSRCLTNQHFLAQCLSNYLPDEDDPDYAKFEANYPAYKQDLEKRYPPVCPSCEPRVRNHLKKRSHVAKSDILAKALKHDRAETTSRSSSGLVSILLHAALWLAELLWISAIVTQATWHVLETKQAFGGGWIERPEESGQLHIDVLRFCMSSLIKGDAAHQVCHLEFAKATKLALRLSVLLGWWNPTIRRQPSRRRRGYFTFYSLQATVLAIRYLAWTILGNRTLSLDRPTLKAAHAFCLAVLAMDLILSYRVILQVAKPKIEFRSLDTPLIEQDERESLQTTPKQVTDSARSSVSRLSISNLRPRRDFSPVKTARSSSLASTATSMTDVPKRMVLEDADAMEWEPSEPTPVSSLRPRFRGRQHQVPPSPVIPVSSPQTTSPFYGSLPPAPQSLNARLRSAAQKQPAQFKPTTDTKQADWFKRMGLAQSQTSWANKDYIRRVTPPAEERGLELQPGKLSLETLGLAKDDGTGLEDIFGRTFRLGDSPVREERGEAVVVDGTGSLALGRFEKGVVAVPVLAALWMGFSYLIPGLASGISGVLYHVAQVLKEMAYGRSIE